MASVPEDAEFDWGAGLARPVPLSVLIWKTRGPRSLAFSMTGKRGQGVEDRAIADWYPGSGTSSSFERNRVVLVSVKGQDGDAA